MKICIVVDSLNERAGWGRLARMLGAGFEARGHQVRLIADSNVKAPSEHLIPLRRHLLLNPFRLAQSLMRMRAVFKDCDVVLCLDVNPYGVLTCLASVGLKARVIVYALGTYSLLTKQWWTNIALRWAYGRVDAVFVVSDFVRKKIEHHGFRLARPIVVPVGVDISRFVRRTPVIAPEHPYLLSVGPLKHRKGYHLSVQAFARVAARYPNLVYVIVGHDDGSEYARGVKEQVRRMGLGERVRFFESVDDLALAKLYQEAKLFLLTPVSTCANIEGFGMVYLEAGSCGIPVVGTYDSGAEAAIVHGANGLLAAPDTASIASALVAVLGDDSLSRKLGQAGIARAQEFSWDNVVDLHIKHFNELLKP